MNRLIYPNPTPAEFLSAEDESKAFWLVRWRIGKTQLAHVLRHARFRATLVVALSLLLWCGLLVMFLNGFGFLHTAIPHSETHDEMVHGIFAMFFAALMIMLAFSAGIIMYGSLFHSPETAFLLTIPARTERVFLHKFQDAVLLSSWGFVLLGSPVILAYGVIADAPWYYYLMMFPFVFSFVYIPAAIGAITCMLIIYFIPGKRRLVVYIIGGLLLFAIYWLVWSLLKGPESNLLTPNWFQEILGRLQFTERRLLPSWWLSSGLLEAGHDSLSESLMFLALMFSNALLFRQLAMYHGHPHLPQGIQFAQRKFGENPPRARGLGRSDVIWGQRGSSPTHATLDAQGSAAFSPRSHAVVAVPDFFRALGPVFFQRPPL